MPPKNSEIRKRLRAESWFIDRTRGSHERWRHPAKPGLVTIAGKDSQTPPPGDMGELQKAGRLAMKYVVIYERGPENWGAFAPDLPGYGATAENLDELRELVREGIPSHVEGLRRAGEPVPVPTAIVDAIETV